MVLPFAGRVCLRTLTDLVYCMYQLFMTTVWSLYSDRKQSEQNIRKTVFNPLQRFFIIKRRIVGSISLPVTICMPFFPKSWSLSSNLMSNFPSSLRESNFGYCRQVFGLIIHWWAAALYHNQRTRSDLDSYLSCRVVISGITINKSSSQLLLAITNSTALLGPCSEKVFTECLEVSYVCVVCLLHQTSIWEYLKVYFGVAPAICLWLAPRCQNVACFHRPSVIPSSSSSSSCSPCLFFKLARAWG